VSGPAPTAADAASRVVNQAQTQQRFVNNRTFFQNGSQWVDASLAQNQAAKRVQVKFGSDEYFALARKHPDAPAWLSVGRNVTVVIDGTVYEVVDAS
jgi:hypothetical protein